MGVDLTIAFNVVPQVAPQKGGLQFLASSRVRLDRDYDLWDLIKIVPSHLFPEVIDWYEDDGITSRDKDPYGEPLRYAKAGDLAKLVNSLPDGCSQWNRGVFQFLASINPEIWVALYWH